VSHIHNLIAEMSRNGVSYEEIGAVADCYAGATPASTVAAFWEDGTIPWMSSGEVNKGTVYETDRQITQAGYDSCSTKMVPPNSVVVALAGQGKTRGTVARTRISLCTNQSLCAIVPNDSVNSDFLYYFLQTQYRQLRSVSTGDGTRGGLNLQLIRGYRIPVPALQVQREIVGVLDTFSALKEELEAVLDAEAKARPTQQSYLRSRVLGLDEPSSIVSSVRLSEVVEFISGKAQERLVTADGTVALLTARFISTGGKSVRWVDPESALTPARRGDIAMVMSDLPNGRALAKCYCVTEDGKYSANQRVCLLRVRDETTMLASYLYHFLDRNPQLLAFDNGQDQTHLKKGQILGIQVPIIPFADQEHTALMLERLGGSTRELVAALGVEQEARRSQFEHYRDRLLMFDEATA
jgi:type I restriction enzyme S subunit